MLKAPSSSLPCIPATSGRCTPLSDTWKPYTENKKNISFQCARSVVFVSHLLTCNRYIQQVPTSTPGIGPKWLRGTMSHTWVRPILFIFIFFGGELMILLKTRSTILPLESIVRTDLATVDEEEAKLQLAFADELADECSAFIKLKLHEGTDWLSNSSHVSHNLITNNISLTRKQPL